MHAKLVPLLGPLVGLLCTIATPRAHGDPPAHARSDTTIVLVHGAWADGSSWDKVVPILEAKGYNVVAVHLPLTSTADDIAATTRAIDQQPGEVVLVGHSYGGFVIGAAGNDPKVRSLVYIDAFALDEGETINGLSKGGAQPAWANALRIDGGGYAWLTLDIVEKDFAQDLSLAQQKLLAAKQGPIPVKSLDDPARDPAWKHKPSWYVRGTDDRIIPPAAQNQMAKRMRAKMSDVDSGHVAMLSKPHEVAEAILQAAAPVNTASR
ncbi:MAG TPA: alpha/beta hydrolase [Kofleriaceae bacterium]|jgi:pimeloyl-ACP methyl ester carboxylesterase